MTKKTTENENQPITNYKGVIINFWYWPYFPWDTSCISHDVHSDMLLYVLCLTAFVDYWLKENIISSVCLCWKQYII